MLAKRLLELTEEFMNVDAEYMRAVSLNEEPWGRSKEEIAEEYERVLRELLTPAQAQ